MRIFLPFFFALALAGGCDSAGGKQVLVKINDYEMTAGEFEAEFKDSLYGQVDTVESRKQFLDSLIDRKLVLQDAQSKGLDKEKDFLKTIERFWEQSLLKVSLDAKTREISGCSQVSDAEVLARFEAMSEEDRGGKTAGELSAPIKEQLILEKETKVLNVWLDELHKKARIRIEERLLGAS
jgi:hypothetical protein